MRSVLGVLLAALCMVFLPTGGPLLIDGPGVAHAQESELYVQPQLVDIAGYNGHAMEPFISPDGRFLFFNNSSVEDGPHAKELYKRLYFAERAGPLSFRFLGELPGVNTHMREGMDAAAASLDLQGRFYFTSGRQYEQDFHTVFAGQFDGRGVTNVRAVEGNISPVGEPGSFNMDVQISLDGNTLYISRVRHNLITKMLGLPPTEMRLIVARRDGDNFNLDPNSAAILQRINTQNFEYAAAISSDGRELYFNRGTSSVMVANRSSPGSAFGEPRAIKAISGFVEAPTVSRDGKEMFFHKEVNGRFVVFRALRNPLAQN